MTDLETQVKRGLELSEKATEGPWIPRMWHGSLETPTGLKVCFIGHGPIHVREEMEQHEEVICKSVADSEFIAHCNPAFVKALCESWLELCWFRDEIQKKIVPGVCDTGESVLAMAKERDTLRAQVEKMRVALGKAKELREAQKTYMANRGDDVLGKKVAEAASELDDALREIDEALK